MASPLLRGVPIVPRLGPVLADTVGVAPVPVGPAPVPAMGPTLWDAVQGGGELADAQPLADGPIHFALPTALTGAPAPATSEYTPPHHGRGEVIAGIIADALAGAAGKDGPFAQLMQHEREQADARNYETVKWQRDRQGHLADYGEEKKIDRQFAKPEAFEQYATAQGFEPGTPAYAQAVQDYRLGAWSNPALENRTALEGTRAGHRSALQTLRDADHLRETGMRLGVARRGQDLQHGDRVRGQTMTDSRVRGSATYQGRGGRGLGAAATAVGPDGHQIIVKNGRWVDAQTGQPVQ